MRELTGPGCIVKNGTAKKAERGDAKLNENSMLLHLHLEQILTLTNFSHKILKSANTFCILSSALGANNKLVLWRAL